MGETVRQPSARRPARRPAPTRSDARAAWRPPFAVRGCRAFAVVGGALLLAAATWLLLGRIAGLEVVANALAEADPRWLVVCVAGETLSYLGYVLAYRETSRVDGGPDLPLGVAAQVTLLGVGGTALAATPGGLAVDYWALHEAGASREEAFTRVLALNTAKWFALGLAAAFAGLLVVLGAVPGPRVPAWTWLAAVGLSVVLALRVGRPRTWRTRAATLRRPQGRLEKLWRLAGRGFADGVEGVVYVRKLLARPRTHAGALVGFPLYWAGDAACLYAALHAFGVGAEPVPFVLAYATGYAATGLPLPLGGSGGIEAAMTFALHVSGIPLAHAFLAAATYRLFGFWLQLPAALVVVSRTGRLRDRLAGVRRHPPP